MAKKSVKKEICETCGAEVRSGSVFCYNCGGAVSPEAEKFAKKEAKSSDVWFQNDLGEKNDLKTTKLKKVETIEVKPIAKPSDDGTTDKNQPPPIGKPVLREEKAEEVAIEKVEIEETVIEEKPVIEKPSIREDAKLKSAANLRRRAKTFQKKTVEVVWEEPETAPNKWFPIVAILLILLVVGIFYLAMYLK